jgi:hypothetical protein
MPLTSDRPLLDPQRRALAAAAGLVGRPRLRAGLALTLAFACGPLPDDVGPGESGEADDTTVADAGSTAAPTTGGPGETSLADTGDIATTSSAGSDGNTGGGTLLTDATTFASSTGETADTGGTDTGDSTGTGDTGELDDCILDRRTGEMDWACCEAQNWEPHPQCTPWGPPAPPSADLLLRARAARRVLA